MPDPYWEAFGKDLRAKKEAGSGIPCAACGEKFESENRDQRTCSSCRESMGRRPGPWRGKGSFGTRPVGFGQTEEQRNEAE